MEWETLPYFISDHEGFHGTIKTSPKDFVVTEIDAHGQLVTNSSIKENHSKTPCQSTIKVEVKSKQPKDDTEFNNQDCFDLNAILGPSVNNELEHFTNKIRIKTSPCKGEQESMELSLGTFADKNLRAVVHRAVRQNLPFLQTVTNQSEIRVREDQDFKELAKLSSEGEAEEFFRFIDAKAHGSAFTFLPDESKEHRTSVHHFVSRRFGKLVETKSFTDQNKTSITVRLREKSKQPKKRTMADCQEEEVTLYTAFILQKENLETLEAISYMAVVLGVLPYDFTYVGIKDKKAVTYQAMVVKKISPEKLLEKAAELERRGMKISRIQSVSEPLKLGRLQGNHFDVVIRDLKPHGKHELAMLEELVREAVENVKNNGFVNYYGPQRFGSGSCVQADQIGLALLKEEMETSVRLFFTPEDGDNLQNKAKQHFLLTGNAKESLALMPAYKARERLMLRALHRYGSGHEGCVRGWLSLPHAMRLFYLHSYCSRVWNEAATYRLQKLGFKAVLGDLVWCGSERVCKDTTDELNATQVHVVTSEEEMDDVFLLDQVILPMPGNNIKYPESLLGKWYQERLAQDGLGSCRFRVTPLKLNIPGCYRPLLAKPQNISYSFQTAEESQTRQSDEPCAPSLSIAFDLDASCYATVCLREIMKCCMS